MILEDENMRWQMTLTAVQAARSPTTKKGAKGLERYIKGARKQFEGLLTPWVEAERSKAIKARLRGRVKPMVIAEGPGPDLDGLKELAERSDLVVKGE